MYRLNRYIAHSRLAAGFDACNGIDYCLAFDDSAKYGVSPAALRFATVI